MINQQTGQFIQAKIQLGIFFSYFPKVGTHT